MLWSESLINISVVEWWKQRRAVDLQYTADLRARLLSGALFSLWSELKRKPLIPKIPRSGVLQFLPDGNISRLIGLGLPDSTNSWLAISHVAARQTQMFFPLIGTKYTTTRCLQMLTPPPSPDFHLLGSAVRWLNNADFVFDFISRYSVPGHPITRRNHGCKWKQSAISKFQFSMHKWVVLFQSPQSPLRRKEN